MKFLNFDISEYESRWQKCQKEMEKEGIDVLVLSQDTNVIYMTGYRTQLYDSNFRPFITVLKKGDDPVLIVPNLEEGSGRKESWFDDVRIWGGNCKYKNAIEVVKAIFKEKNLDGTSVGMELDNGQRLGMLQSEFEELKGAFPGCTFKSCASMIWRIRRIKSAQEIAYFQEACRISDVSFEAVINTVKEGMTEKDIQKIMGSTMMKEGADFKGFIVINSGIERYDMMSPWASERVLKKGDMVVLDFGAAYKGYLSDITRGIFIGSISPRQKELYEAAQKINQAAVGAVKPGIPVGDIDRAAMKKTEELGYADLVLHRGGHSLGLDVHEIPSIAASDNTRVEPGMCFAIEPAIYDYSVGAFRIEDNFVVTKDGCTRMTNCTREIVVL